jgi:hypothetical protein
MSDELVSSLRLNAEWSHFHVELYIEAADRIENLTNALEGIKQWSSYSGSTQHIYEMACNALNPDFAPPTNEKETK